MGTYGFSDVSGQFESKGLEHGVLRYEQVRYIGADWKALVYWQIARQFSGLHRMRSLIPSLLIAYRSTASIPRNMTLGVPQMNKF
jgi:hypothetical protein